jgi:hypothetical protein
LAAVDLHIDALADIVDRIVLAELPDRTLARALGTGKATR